MFFVIGFLVSIAIFILIEFMFRRRYFKKNGKPYHVSIKFPWKESQIIPHPYLSFAYRRNSAIDRNQKLPYPLHTNEYYSFKKPLVLNSLGHFGQEFSGTKEKNTIRIACLGDSTTANNIADESKDYSYPRILEEKLNEIFRSKKKKIRAEIWNCGIGGWVSADIMINYLLNLLPLKPDYIILMHAFTELHLYLTEEFSTDYLHGRKNYGEVESSIKKGYYFPKFPFWQSYEYAKDKLFGTGNARNEVIQRIRKLEIDINREYRSLEVEKNILKNILIVSRYYGVKVLLATYPFYEYKNDPMTKKIAEGVRIENENTKKLALEFKTLFCDLANEIPYEEKYFLEWVHFTILGMEFVADLFSKQLSRDILKRTA